MSRHLTRTAIGTGIALSLFGWGAARMGEITFDALCPTGVAAPKPAIPHLSVHLSIEVRP